MSAHFKKGCIGLLVTISIAGLLLWATSSKAVLEQPTMTPMTQNSPAQYLTNVLDIVQEHALYSSQILDWPAFRKQLLAMISNAQTTADTYSTIRYLIQRMNDNHSQLWPPNQAAQFSDHTGIGVFGMYVPPVVKRLANNLGYVQLPQVITETDYSTYVETVYTLLKQISQPPVCGWVIDLRADQGGNMFPMLAALGPILGNGELGIFIDKNGQKSTWFYRDGVVGVGDNVVFQSTPLDLGVDYSVVPVALLTDSLTASAGEAVVISFSGRKQTKRFGTSTAGLITANRPYPLSDGAVLLLAEAREADRTGYIFVGRISPDVYVASGVSSADDVLAAAADWLKNQC
jgi:carboxyl-terminal processing protease